MATNIPFSNATMYTEADLHDVMDIAMGKDFAGRAGQVADLVRRARPHSGTLLDVACGTGEHAQYLSEVHGFEVDGIDLSPEMLAKARLFTADDMLAAFSAVGLAATYDPTWRDEWSGDGVYVASARPA